MKFLQKQIMANESDEMQHNSKNGVEAMATAPVGMTMTTASEDEGRDTINTQTTIEQQHKDKGIDDGEERDEMMATCAHGKLNDLVADLCINGTGASVRTGAGAFGDYTNIRATVGPLGGGYVEGLSQHLPDNSFVSSGSTQPAIHVQPAPTQNSSFSFKHFLSSSTAMTTPSTTITSLDPATTSVATSLTSTASTINSATNALQTSTGARPKVPQSASVSATSISSLMTGGGGLSATAAGSQESSSSTKMKRSPRFSSFDSQASLAEYAGGDSNMEGVGGSGGSITTGFRLYPDALGGGSVGSGESNDIFATRSTSNTVTTNSGDYEVRQSVPRSYSNYDMPMPSASPRRRMGFANLASTSATTSKEARPTRLALNTNSSKLKLDLPIDNAASVAGASAASSSRPLSGNVGGDFPPPPPPAAAAAAALPDFVQDHWMDSWYAHEMHLNSPPNSPIRDFVEDLTCGASTATGGGSNANSGIGSGGASSTFGSVGASGGGGGGTNESSSTGNSKMLPDFLSDGPIIHSSQRLADVAAGLPSNSIGSPEDPPMQSSQLSRLRIENERLQRELNDARAAQNEQTRRANDLERQLQELQRGKAGYNRSMSQNITQVEENLDKSKRRTAAAQNHVTELKQKVTQLTAENETLRRENDVLREEGAVGGCSAPPSCDRPRPYATSATAAAAAGVRGNAGSRPSTTQQISRDLLRAASSAESNLRQLLVGVNNLRQMAADIENSESRQDYDVSPDLFSDFLDDCDDYEEYPGGPAL